MTSRDGPIARAARIADEDLVRLRSDLSRARRGAGLSHADVGRRVGMSRTKVARLEAGTRPTTVRELAEVGGAVGLDVRLRSFPAGDPIRDAGQLQLLERLRQRLDPALSWQTEVPLPIPGNLRAWDALITGRGWRVAVEAETVLDDLQAVERRISLKRRDGRMEHVILIVADTRRNRGVLAGAPQAMPSFSRRARRVLGALRRGHDPRCSAIVVL